MLEGGKGKDVLRGGSEMMYSREGRVAMYSEADQEMMF